MNIFRRKRNTLTECAKSISGDNWQDAKIMELEHKVNLLAESLGKHFIRGDRFILKDLNMVSEDRGTCSTKK